VERGYRPDVDIATIADGNADRRLIAETGVTEMYHAQQLSKTAIKIRHYKAGFEAFCEAKMKIRGFALILTFGCLTVARGGISFLVWPELPEHIKAAVRALIQTCTWEKK
jgi:hypothetical protein